jgi:hypothetical protein
MSEKTEKTAPSRPELIPVRELKFRQGFAVDVPGKNAVSGVRATDPSSGAYWRLFYDPRIRHHRIEHYAPGDGDRKPRVMYVPESWCTWEPA